jgi:hypothetical protein
MMAGLAFHYYSLLCYSILPLSWRRLLKTARPLPPDDWCHVRVDCLLALIALPLKTLGGDLAYTTTCVSNLSEAHRLRRRGCSLLPAATTLSNLLLLEIAKESRMLLYYVQRGPGGRRRSFDFDQYFLYSYAKPFHIFLFQESNAASV